MRRLAALLPAVLAATAVAACGSGEERPAATPPATTQLHVEVTGVGTGAISVELRCGAADPCEQRTLDQLARVVKPDDPAQACTLQYGGPERAHLTGTLEGKRVDVTVGRANGCEIADYEALFEALGRKPPTAR